MYQKNIKVRKAGFSLEMTIPVEICKNLNIKAGSVLEAEEQNNQIILKVQS